MHDDDTLTAASATPLVLTALGRRDCHGYEIVKVVRELSGGHLEWSDGMLYPLLHRLHRLGYLHPEWRLADGTRRRRYYALTGAAAPAGSQPTRPGLSS